MFPNQPQIAGLSDRIGGSLRHHVVCRRRRSVPGFVQQKPEFVLAEADGREVEVLPFQFGKLGAEQIVVPAALFRQPIVGDDVGAFLSFGKVVEDDDGNFREPQLAGGKKASVPGDDARSAVHQNGRVESELADACGNLRDLRIGVSARISGERDQSVGRPEFDVASHYRHKQHRTA